jgi:hypothetical protein
MGARTILLGVALVAGCGAQQVTDPMQVLGQMRQRLAENVKRLPNFLCTEMVDRSTFNAESKGASCSELGEAKRLHSTDRLRLDVGIANNHEIYSWVGEGRFGDQSLGDLVKTGTTATGSFSSFLSAIFATDAATFAYKGEADWNGRKALNYTFQVPLARSGYTLSSLMVSRRVAYSGTFSIDAQTLDLRQLEIRADDIPPELKMCSTSTVLIYKKVNLNRQDFLLPSEGTTQVISTNGSQSINRTVFSGCHQFLGESKLVFDDQPADGTAAQKAKAINLELPAGKSLFTELAENIDPNSAAAGEAIKGRLTNPLEIPALHLTIPKGTLLNGRLCELFVQYDPLKAIELGLKWETMAFQGNLYPLHLALDAALPDTAKVRDVQARAHPSGVFADPSDENTGYFLFLAIKKRYQIPAGFESIWIIRP